MGLPRMVTQVQRSAATRSGPNVLLVFPRFSGASFWKLAASCEITGRRCVAPPLGLITVAALLPSDWAVRLVDLNAEELRDEDLDWADLIMTGGMIPQQPDTLRLIELCRSRGLPVAVGGPDATSSPHIYARANFRVVGEAESVMGAFVDAWRQGVREGVFEAELYKTDITTSPVPRFDLLNQNYYIDYTVQFSRGCPFTCEFCDIIELYGRVPRTKTVDQLLAELEAIYRLGVRGTVEFVDDNLIGNKKAVKAFLPHLAAWQRERGYPFSFLTQASINLADDDAFMDMMRTANFELVFIGIESPNTETLISAQKKQNTRRNLADSIARMRAFGLTVTAGFIIGFDTEKDGVAEEMVEYIAAAAIPICMVGMLTATPNTQLTSRLKQEGRLRPDQDVSVFDPDSGGDQCTGGLNFDTVRPRKAILADYRYVLDRIYEPAAFFARVRSGARQLRLAKHKKKLFLSAAARDARSVMRMLWRLVFRQREMLKPFGAALIDCLLHNPAAVRSLISQTIMYLYVGPFARQVVASVDRQLAAPAPERPQQTPERLGVALPAA